MSSNMNELYAKKIGMTRVFNDMGNVVPVTILSLEPNIVIAERTKAKNGYDAKILSAFKRKPKHVNKAQAGLFPEGVELSSLVFESKGFDDKKISDLIGIEIFEHTVFVDITGISKGRGYQGVMKRHGAHGGPAGHGSKFHRHIGSSGQSADPSRIRKGTKGAGRMGNDTVTVQNIRIIKLDKERNYVIVQGSVPGAINSKVRIKPSIKKIMHVVTE